MEINTMEKLTNFEIFYIGLQDELFISMFSAHEQVSKYEDVLVKVEFKKNGKPYFSEVTDELDRRLIRRIEPKIFFLNLAKQLAKHAHAGQTDRAGVDYFEGHVTTVANGCSSTKAKTVAYLHDVVEDTKVTQQIIERFFPEDVAGAVYLLTRDNKLDYDHYIKRLKANDLAREVKLSDLYHNSDRSRLSTTTQKDLDRFEKYRKAIHVLSN